MNAKRTFSISYIFLMLSFYSFGQSNQINSSFLEAYYNYFKSDRKSVHLHLNKTVFLTGEHIWFSAYIFNQTKNLPSTDKEFVYVDLINNQGEVLAQKTILFSNGIGNGELFLTNSLSSGLYFLQVYTASMQNFEEDDSTKYPVLVNNSSTNNFVNYEYYKKTGKPEIIIAPEGGKLLSNVLIKCVTKASDEMGRVIVPDSAFLVNNENKRISKLNFNKHGFGSFSLVPNYGEQYSLKLYQNGTILKKELPPVEKSGVTLAVARNPHKNEIVIQVFDTRIDEKERFHDLSFLIHKDQNIIDFEIEKYLANGKYEFKINYDVLFEGVNTFSILDGKGKIQTSRIFYQRSDLQPKQFAINNENKKSDSIELAVKHYKNFEDDWNNLSISILPGETRAQRFRKKAFFALQLEPYFNGPDWRDLWTKEIKSFEDLDFMDQLSILAKPKYQWKNILNKNLSIPDSNFYTGAIEGVVEPRNKNVKPQMVVLYSKTNELLMNAEVSNNKFIFNELVLEKGSKLNLSLIGEDGKPYKANFSYTIKPIISNYRHRFSTNHVHQSENFMNELSQVMSITENTQQLDEVIVTAKKLKYQRFFPTYQSMKVDSSSGFLNLGDFVRKQGFSSILISPRAKGRRAGTLQIAKRNQRCGLVFPSIVLDGVYDQYFDSYENIGREYIDEIYWDRPNACSIKLVVFTNDAYKNRPLPSHKITSKEITIDKGFDTPKPFTRDEYFETSNVSFKHFGILGWESAITRDNNQSLKLKVPIENEKKIMVIIEGYSDTGKILSENHFVSLN
ncbi:hypothetical protein [Croceitalea sp. P059]|uniref:hypothetical protein n=1 Tax=Croceitalea sp. P059 TaxID=3075601 RepID=UPI00288439D2|nr:hypothetical protein [Croceitalea sp. P059]MDT0538230.1 hypothetical protein [Croceitalea sp. P059]